MLEETFQQGRSFLHRADPRAKIVSAFLLIATIAVLNDLFAAACSLFISVLFLLVARLPIRRVIKRLIIVNAFIAFLWFFLPFSVHGRGIFSIWKWEVTIEGVKFALLITIKCNAILLIIISFIATTPFPLLGFALSSLRFPTKLTLLMLISYRYISVIKEEYDRLLEAAKVRGFVPRNNMHTYRTYAYLLAMVFIRSYERGLTVYQAMLLRGFNGKFYSLRKFRLARGDILLSIIIGFCIMFLVYFNQVSNLPRPF